MVRLIVLAVQYETTEKAMFTYDIVISDIYIYIYIYIDTTIYHVTKGYAISAIVTELKMKLTFY